jgi:hypothetical protein
MTPLWRRTGRESASPARLIIGRPWHPCKDAGPRHHETGGYAEGPLRANLSYDDFDSYDDLVLVVSIAYRGPLPYVASEQKLPAGMVEEQIFAVGLSVLSVIGSARPIRQLMRQRPV